MDAVEVAMADKKNDRNEKLMEFVNSVLRKKPELKPKIDALCDRYKVKF